MVVSEIILVRAEQTCHACPSQWDAWDLDGRYWYLRYRHGIGTMGRDYLERRLWFDTGDGSGFIDLDEFCQRIGVTYMPSLATPYQAYEAPPSGG